jgi:hypothetical protein
VGEKLQKRNGQILGTEKLKCSICQKITAQDVIYFPRKQGMKLLEGAIVVVTIMLVITTIDSVGVIMGAIIGAIGGGIVGIVGVTVTRVAKPALPTNACIAYRCHTCKHTVYTAENQEKLKEKYNWNKFSGFKGKPIETIEFLC